MSDVELVIESISIPAEGFSKDISERSPADEGGYSEQACDTGLKFLAKFCFFDLVFSVAGIKRRRSYVPLTFSRDNFQDYIVSAGSQVWTK